MHAVLKMASPVLQQGHQRDSPAAVALCHVMLDRLKMDFARQLAAQPTWTVRQIGFTSGTYDSGNMWHLLGMLRSDPSGICRSQEDIFLNLLMLMISQGLVLCHI